MEKKHYLGNNPIFAQPLGKATDVQLIADVLSKANLVNGKKTLFKKTEIAFKKRYGIDFYEAPMFFQTADGWICYLSFSQYTFKGRKCEGEPNYLGLVYSKVIFPKLRQNAPR